MIQGWARIRGESLVAIDVRNLKIELNRERRGVDVDNLAPRDSSRDWNAVVEMPLENQGVVFDQCNLKIVRIVYKRSRRVA